MSIPTSGERSFLSSPIAKRRVKRGNKTFLCESSFFRHINDEGNLTNRYSAEEWLLLCRELKSHGVLFSVIHEIREYTPKFILRVVDDSFQKHRESCIKKLAVLSKFAEAASREHLHFAVIKGVSLPKILYGGEFIRESGDIDILINSEDISKADYVARSVGFFQPGEMMRAYKMQLASSLNGEVLESLQAPYPLRETDFLPHIGSYYYPLGEGNLVELEVHDKFHRIDSLATNAMLWSAEKTILHDHEYYVCSNECAFMFTILSAYTDSETVRANTGTAAGSVFGGYGIKAYIDLFFWIKHQIGSTDWRVIKNVAKTLGVEREMSCVLFNLCDLFPKLREQIETHFAVLPSPWKLPYLERFEDAHLRNANGISTVKQRLFEDSDQRDISYKHLEVLPYFGSTWSSGIQCEAKLFEGACSLKWTIPSYFLERVESLVFQVALLFPNESDFLGHRLSSFSEHGIWQSWKSPVWGGTVDGHGSKKHTGEQISVTALSSDGTLTLTLACAIGCNDWGGSVLAIPIVYENAYGRMYRIVAGCDVVRYIEDRLGV